MRHAPAGGIVLLFLLTPLGFAGERYVVKQNLTEVRAEAGDKAENYVTNRLHKGDVVEVVEAGRSDGWLLIKPPPGSTSWINTRFLAEVGPKNPIEVVAFEDGAPVFPGPADATDRRPGVIGARLKKGHLVSRRGRMLASDDGHWMEIESPESEARYVRADAVERTKQDVVQ